MSEPLSKGEQLRDAALARFAEKARAKYDAGQAEHKDFLGDRACLGEVENEIMDLWFYVQAIRWQQEREQD